jgi:NAD(P)-dependent dehydrogenase (short-subunit alcohol dehydrogenase family)
MATSINSNNQGMSPLHTDQACDCCLVSRQELARLRDNQQAPVRRFIVLLSGARLGGIGHAILMLLTRLGHTVIVAERNRLLGRQAVHDARRQGGDAWLAHLDASDEQRVNRLMTVIKHRWGCLDAVINNAGWAGTATNLRDTFLDLDAAGLLQLLTANLVSAFVVSRAALRRFFLHQPEGGTCIFLGSTNGQPGNGTQIGYACAKTALSALVRAGATEHGRHCRYLLVRPGIVETDSAGWRERRAKDKHYVAKEGLKIPLGRLARPEEVAALIAFLLSPDAAYLQGCEINCDGGLMASGNLLPGEASRSRDAYVELVDLVNKAAIKPAA